MYLDDAIAAYEVDNGPIAARKLTRVAATFNLKRVFWTTIWPEIRNESIPVKWGWFKVSVRVELLKPIFERIFGPEVDPSADTETPA